MKLSKLLCLFLFCLILLKCNIVDQKDEKKPILLADREAPLGWIHLKIYNDKSFEFISRGLRTEDIYSGTYILRNDTLYFNYKDSIPKAGKTAIIFKENIVYIDGEYRENVNIKLNNLTK